MDTLFRIIALIFAIIAVMRIIHVISHIMTKRATIYTCNVWMQCVGMPVVPRVSCCRRKDDAMLARAVNDNDLLLCGSAHGVPTDVGCRR